MAKPKPVMRKVVKAKERKYENVSRTYKTISISYRKVISYTLECGHKAEKHGHCGITPSSRVKCEACTAAASEVAHG